MADQTTPIRKEPLPDPADLRACAAYVCEASRRPDLNITYDLHEGMRRLQQAVRLSEAGDGKR